MMDVDTFLITLYVMIDDLCKLYHLDYPAHRGPQARLSCSEVITLSLFGQWAQFPSERAFYRYAQRRLRWAFPDLPDRSQFNRHQNQLADLSAQVSLFLADCLPEGRGHYEILDSSGVAVRHIKRRGTGWLAAQADKGWCSRISSYCGFHLLLSCTPGGSSLASVLVQPSAMMSHWPKRCLPHASSPRLVSRVPGGRQECPTWLIAALQAISLHSAGEPAMALNW